MNTKINYIIPGKAADNIPEGDYPFRVTGYSVTENYRVGNMPYACPKVSVSVEIAGSILEKHIDFFLNSWIQSIDRLRDFFISIGLIKNENDSFAIDFDAAIGRTGYAHFVPRTTRHGTVYNATKFIAPMDVPVLPAPIYDEKMSAELDALLAEEGCFEDDDEYDMDVDSGAIVAPDGAPF